MVTPDGSRSRRLDASRAFARRLAADSIASGDDTGWFETLYAAAGHGTATVPWADLTPNQHLVSALAGVCGGGRAAGLHHGGLRRVADGCRCRPAALSALHSRVRHRRPAVAAAFLGRRVRPCGRGVHPAGAHRRGAAHGLRADRSAGRARRAAARHRGGRATSTTTRARCRGRSPGPRSGLFANTG